MTERLKEILQKKLFDMQCLWRAEKIIIPEINVSSDFRYWEANIFNCPFIEPVTENEIEIILKHLTKEEPYRLDHDIRLAPEWIRVIMRKAKT